MASTCGMKRSRLISLAVILALTSLVEGACSPRPLPPSLTSGTATTTFTVIGQPPERLALDGFRLSGNLPLRLSPEAGPHELTVGSGGDAAKLPLLLGLPRTEVVVSCGSRAAAVFPAASHLLPAYAGLTALRGPDKFASFMGWLDPSRALVLVDEASYSWDLAKGTIEKLWRLPASWVSEDGRGLAASDDYGLVLKDLVGGSEQTLLSWSAIAGQMGARESSVLAEGGWVALSVFSEHDEPVWPDLYLFQPGDELVRLDAAQELADLAPGYVPQYTVTASSASTFFVASNAAGQLRIIEVSWPDGEARTSAPVSTDGWLRPCGLWGGKFIFVAFGEVPTLSGRVFAYDLALASLEPVDLGLDAPAVFGAVNPVTGSLWLGLAEGEARATLVEIPAGSTCPTPGGLTIPVSNWGLALHWAPDGRRAFICDSWGGTNLLVYDPPPGP